MKIDIDAGVNILDAMKFAIDRSYDLGTDVQFVFNEIELDVSEYSRARDILRIYDLKCEIRRLQSK